MTDTPRSEREQALDLVNAYRDGIRRPFREPLADAIVKEYEPRAARQPAADTSGLRAALDKQRLDYLDAHDQSVIDEREFGPKAGAHDRWKARAEGIERAIEIVAALSATTPEATAPGKPDGWHTYHICGGRLRELTWSGHQALCVVCGVWFTARLTEQQGSGS